MAADGLKIPPGDVQQVVQPNQPTGNKRPVEKSEALKESEVQEESSEKNKLDADFVAEITQELNDEFRIFNSAVSFSVDDNTGTTVIKILDRQTDKVIREIPPSELLTIAARLTEVIGRLIDETA